MSDNQHSTTRRDLLKLAGGAASLAVLGAGLPTLAQAAAPMLGVLRPKIYRFKLGNFEVTNILDGLHPAAEPAPDLGANQSAEAVQALAQANGLRTQFENPYVSTLVNTGKELVLFDTGNGKGRQPTTGNLRDLIVTAGYRPEQIDVVVITHGHPDHIGGLDAGRATDLPQRAHRLRRGGVRLLAEGRRARGAQDQPRAVHARLPFRSASGRRSSSPRARW